MTSWIVDALDTDLLEQAHTEASRRLLNHALGLTTAVEDDTNLCFIANALELAVMDLLNDEEQIDTLREVSADAFQLLRVLSRPKSPMEAAKVCLRLTCLGVLGERGTDASRLLKESPWPKLPIDSPSWGERTLATILDVWLRLIRKDGWKDLDEVQARVISLREQQSNFEAEYLEDQQTSARTAAWELVVLYHLAKAAELQAVFTIQGQVDGYFDIHQQLEAQFDRALSACARAELMELDALTRLLARTAQQGRGIKLELLLATIKRECRDAQFLLLTPFIHNAAEIARWLAPDSNSDIGMRLDWKPNDRAVVLSHPRQGDERGQFSLYLETIHTNRDTLEVPETLSLDRNRPLGLRWSDVKNNASKLASATAQLMKERGAVIVLASRPDWVWSLAKNFKHPDNRQEVNEDVRLMEWLFEKGHIHVMVATTTIAQGVNFPVSGIVLAQNKYYDKTKGSVKMPPEDFWNLAGRAGRVEQGSVGIIALAAMDEEKAVELREFVGYQVLSLNSTLIKMVEDAMKDGEQLELHRLFNQPEWSAFLQYLAHTYRQIGDPYKFADQIELVLRGTLGFEKLRHDHPNWANQLVFGVEAYAERLAGKSLALVDSTGFSWESVSITLGKIAEERITERVWDPEQLFSEGRTLQSLMGILLSVPELRENLEAAAGGRGTDGNRLACMVRDWVNGVSLPEMSEKYFATDDRGNAVDPTKALTDCCKNIFGKLTQTTAWGLAALQSMTFKDEFDRLSEDEQQTLRNLPARVFYGVNTDEAIALRLIGVPREAAQSLAQTLGDAVHETPLPQLRTMLAKSDVEWSEAMGAPGRDYFKIWRILEGIG